MGETSKYKLPWPEMNQSSDGPGAYRKLAEATEVAFNTVTLPPPGMMRHRSADFNVSGSSGTVPFTLDLTTYSSGTGWTTGSYGHPILPKTGRWLLVLSVTYGNVSGAAGSRYSGIFVDGVALSGAGMILPYNPGHSTAINVSVARVLAKGKRVGLYGWQNSGKTIPCTEAHLSCNYLGP